MGHAGRHHRAALSRACVDRRVRPASIAAVVSVVALLALATSGAPRAMATSGHVAPSAGPPVTVPGPAARPTYGRYAHHTFHSVTTLTPASACAPRPVRFLPPAHPAAPT